MTTAKQLLLKITAGASFVAAGIASAHAELPAVIGTEFAKVQGDGLALADLVWPVLMAIFGALLLMKLGKRFGNKI